MSLDDQIRDATEALSRRLREEFDAEVTRLSERLSASLEADRAAELASALEKARAEAEQQLAHALATSRAEAEHRLESAVAQARTEAQQAGEAAAEQARTTVSEQLEAARTEARLEAEARLRAEQDRVVEVARAEARLETERRLESELTQARAEAESRLGEVEAAARAEAEQRLASEIAGARAEAQRMVDDESASPPVSSEAAVASAKAEAKDLLEKQLAASRVDADRRLEAEVARLRAQHEVALEKALAESQTQIDEQIAAAVDAALAEEAQEAKNDVDVDVSPMWAASEGEGDEGGGGVSVSAQSVRRRSLDAVRRLDAATSLTGLLDGLLAAVGADAARAAVLVLRGDRLRGWGADGFGDRMGEPRSLDLALEPSDLIGRAMADARAVTSQPEESGPEEVLSLPAFARLPSGCVAVAAPVMVGGRAVGAVYADDGGDAQRTTSSGWLEAVELLTIHASRCAEALTAARAVELLGAPTGDAAAAPVPENDEGNDEDDGGVQAARRYARLLVSEIRLYNEDAVRAGREHRDLAHRLRAEIARARELFAERTPADLPLAEALFTEELVRTLADGDAGLMGDDEPGAPS